AGTAYGIFTDWSEWVGTTAVFLTGGMFAMIAFYFKMLERRHGKRAEDRHDAEISEDAGEQGVFAPWSWWPLVCAAGAALAFTALAVGWWIMVPAAVVGVIGLVGWVFEFSRGQHAH
ncbi:MAG: cytochrome c oxidase subunit 4, partial [Actinomycetes bacterium]|nr:cytochrome c oxidase subunit 4 [Actinomycetes bacterium]